MIIRALVACALSLPAAAQLPTGYVETGRFDRAVGALDFLNDGRVVGLSGNAILVQDEINGDAFTQIATIQPNFVGDFGPSFLAVSPDGTRLAIGDGVFGAAGDAQVGIFDLNTGALQSSIDAANFSGIWTDNNTLFVSGGTFSESNLISRIDVSTATATTVIDDTAGFSAALATDGELLYTANGFSIGTTTESQTGEVRTFALSDLDGSQTFSFENDGDFYARALSAGSLDFDHDGNLIIGGADGVDDAGVIAVVSPLGERADITSPFGSDFNLARFNDVTGEIVVLGGSEIVRFAPIPAPHACLLLGSLLVTRRRRVA